MKTTKAVRLSDNFVGVEINTIQDVVKAQAAGLKLVDKEGWEYSIYTIDDEETGEEREPTEQEIFEHITEDLSKGKEVYACMELSSDWGSTGTSKDASYNQLLRWSAGFPHA